MTGQARGPDAKDRRPRLQKVLMPWGLAQQVNVQEDRTLLSFQQLWMDLNGEASGDGSGVSISLNSI